LTDVSFLKELKGLTYLYLSSNQLTDVSFLKELKGLTYLNLDNNPIKTPPQSIIEKGIDTIRDYYRQQEEQQGTERLFEAKLLFVGEPGAGKTSLMKKIIDPEYEVGIKEEESTVGIEIYQGWKFNCIKHKCEFTVNLWDFGGQPIQYSLHQFFLSSRSLYVLLADDRKQNTDFNYWFDIIELLGNGSPVLVVLNERELKSITGFDLGYYRNRFPNLKIEVQAVDLRNNDGRFNVLIEKIKEMSSNLKHIGEELPKQWIPIRKELEECRNKNYIAIENYFSICKKHEIIEEESQLNLLGYLNDLGIAIHFKDDIKLKDTVFLNHEWTMSSVYSILKDKTLEEGKGIFTQKWLFEFWNKYSYEEKIKLLQLMLRDNFEVCYKMSDKDNGEYLVPRLIQDLRPNYTPFPTNSLRYRIQYVFMPEGIISRLIVRLSNLIERENRKDILWKNGVVLRDNNNRALIIREKSRESGAEVIDICIDGNKNTRTNLLNKIKEEIRSIHKKSFKEINIDEMIACNCIVCDGIEEPQYFKLNDLINYLNHDELKIKCNKSIKDQDIRELLTLIDYNYRGIDLDKTMEVLKKYTKPIITYNNLVLGNQESNFDLHVKNALPGKEKKSRLQNIYWIVGIILALCTILWFYYQYSENEVEKNKPIEKPKTETQKETQKK